MTAKFEIRLKAASRAGLCAAFVAFLPLAAMAQLGVSAPSAPLIPLSAPAALAPSAQPVIVQRAAVVAIVDGEPITNFALTQRMLWLSLGQPRNMTQEQLASLQQEARRSLEDQLLQKHYLLIQERERKLPTGTLFATDEDIDGYLGAMARDNGMTSAVFQDRIQQAGISRNLLRDQIRITISWQQWISRFYGPRVKVSEEEATRRLHELEAMAAEPQYRVSEIFIEAEKVGGIANAETAARNIIAQLQAQGRFDQMAYQYSALPTAANGGDAGWLTEAQLPPEVAPLMADLRPGFVTRPVTTSTGVYLIMLKEKRAGSTSTLVNLKQIAIPLTPNADAATAQAGQNRLLALKAQIKGCDTMDQTARAAGLQVGDLGQADTKDLAPDIKAIVESLQTNQVSDPVRTDAGLHLIALCGRVPSGVRMPSLDEIKNDLTNDRLASVASRELRNLQQSATIREP